MNNHSNIEEEEMNKDLIHETLAKRVKNKMLNDELLFDVAEVFKIFGDSTRMKIIYALKLSELCVSDLAFITNSSDVYDCIVSLLITRWSD